MINLLKSIVDTILALITFLNNIVISFINLFTKIPTYVSFLAASINTLPTVIVPFALASISVYVVYLILGRSRS